MTLQHAFALDSFQKEAIAAVEAGRSVVVSAPTSSGKTVVAEHAVDSAIVRGGRAFYTAPIKALSNQKFRDLKAVFGDSRVGLMTGDQVIAPDSPIVVMTTEVLRNMLYAGSEGLRGLRWVVLDEVHYLEDPYRGAVWEEVVLNLAPDIGIVALSATVSNAEELGDWLRAVRGPTDVVREDRRPVRLRAHYLVSERGARGRSRRLHRVVLHRGKDAEQTGRRFDVNGRTRSGPARQRRWVTPRRGEVLSEMVAAEMLPAIHFIFSRAGCDEARDSVVRDGLCLNTKEEAMAVETRARARLAGVSESDQVALGVANWLEALRRGIASHHAGLVPVFKEITEDLFSAGLLKLVYATETLALGVNLPARSVVVDRLTKFTGETHEILTPGQFSQLSGRAGRRGLDTEGHVLVCWSPFIGYKRVTALADSRDFVLRSAFRPTYNMVANLVVSRSRDEAVDLISRSFAQFQIDRQVAQRSPHGAEIRRESRETLEALPDLCSAGLNTGQRVQAADLRPGDVVDLDEGLIHLVLAVGQRRGGRSCIRLVDQNGCATVAEDSQLTTSPLILGSVEIPTPFLPEDPVFRQRVAKRLNKFLRENSDHLRATKRPAPGGPLDLPKQGSGIFGEIETPDDLVARLAAAHQVLEVRGMADGWSLTTRGQILTGLHHESDLLTAEALSDGLLDNLGPAMLAAMVSCLSYRKRGPGETVGVRLAGEFPDRFNTLTHLAAAIASAERGAGLSPQEEPDPGFAHLVHAWASGAKLEELVGEDLPAGEFVRNVRMVADLLRQLAAVGSPGLQAVATEAEDLLDRGIVAMSAGRIDMST